jgi:hypothetical protein
MVVLCQHMFDLKIKQLLFLIWKQLIVIWQLVLQAHPKLTSKQSIMFLQSKRKISKGMFASAVLNHCFTKKKSCK